MADKKITMERSAVILNCRANNHIYNDQTGECVNCQIDKTHHFLKISMNFVDTLLHRGRELSFDDRLLLLSELITAYQFNVSKPASTVLGDAELQIDSKSISIKSAQYNFCVMDMSDEQIQLNSNYSEDVTSEEGGINE